jgi:hypothetical protein
VELTGRRRRRGTKRIGEKTWNQEDGEDVELSERRRCGTKRTNEKMWN